MGNIMTCKINADTTDGLKLISDTSGEVDIQDNGTTRVTVGDNIDFHGNELILDADGDTSIHADTDDTIHFKIAGTDHITFDANGITVADADNSQPRIILKTTDAGSGSPFLDFIKDSASPADNDNLMVLRNIGDNDAGETVAYVTLLGRSSDVTDGTENGRFHIETIVDGTNAERLCIDSTGNVGVGQASPGTKLDVSGNIRLSAGSPVIELNNGGPQLFVPSANTLGFATGGGIGSPTERARIDSVGRFLVGATASIVNGSSAKSQISYLKNSEFGLFIRPSDNNTGGGQPVLFQNQAGTSIGSIGATASNISYNTSSDYRLKENVDYTWDATTRLKQLRPCRFNWISDDTDTAVDGFLAHEAQTVVPECVTGVKDAVEIWQEDEDLPDGVSVGDNKLDDDGNTIPNYQGIDQSKLVPLLVKTIQELEARITALESE